jgi:hypothetical protein
VIVAVATTLTGIVVTVKFAVVAPAATGTLPGTAAAVLLLDSPTEIPLVGAGPVRVTVPVEGVAPITLVGFRDTDKMAGGFTVSVAVCCEAR